MNLSPSIGYRHAVDDVLGAPGVYQLPMARPTNRNRKSNADRPTTVSGMAFAVWATKLRTFPTVEQVREHFGVSRATAYRWRNMWGQVIKVTPPPIEREFISIRAIRAKARKL